jgi:hypothetical protein
VIAADKKKFIEIILGFSELKGRELSAAAYELFWNAMQHWTLEDFQLAANELVRTCEYMPGPKDFEDLRKAGRATAGEAFDLARRACGTAIQCGQVTHNGSCGDPRIDAAVKAIGGYGVIAMCDTRNLHFLEKRFAEHYEAIGEVSDTRAALPQLAGTFRPALLDSKGKLVKHLSVDRERPKSEKGTQ